MKRTAKPSNRQLNLGVLNEPPIAVPRDKEDELATALVELLIDAARRTLAPTVAGGGDESEVDR